MTIEERRRYIAMECTLNGHPAIISGAQMPHRSKLRSHYAYAGDSIYIAIGRRYTAEGWSDARELFRFSGPSPDDLTRDGPRAIAEALGIHEGSPAYGDEAIEGVTVYYHSAPAPSA